MGKHEVKRPPRGVKKHPAVFLDRDGTIIGQIEVLNDPAQVKLLPGAGKAIAELNRRGYIVIGITNQPAMEKGLITEQQLAAVHAELSRQLQAFGAHLDRIYTCPHRYRPPGDPVPQCACRKPGTKLIEDAESDFATAGTPIDIEQSWFVGDRLRDVEIGKRAHLRTILVMSGGASSDDNFFPDAKPNIFVPNIEAAMQFINKSVQI